jgi:hypothetical protein
VPLSFSAGPSGFVEQLGPKRILHRNICYVNNDEDEENVVATILYKDRIESWKGIVFLPQDEHVRFDELSVGWFMHDAQFLANFSFRFCLRHLKRSMPSKLVPA